MSLVGPRPHAVAHNEEYRRLIHGYMLRHKVKPGITGWAQVNGWRGETDTLDKMQKRVAHDLDYVQNWSLWLDLSILAMTLAVVASRRERLLTMRYLVLAGLMFALGLVVVSLDATERQYVPVVRMRTGDGFFITVVQDRTRDRRQCFAAADRFVRPIEQSCPDCVIESVDCDGNLHGIEQALVSGGGNSPLHRIWPRRAHGPCRAAGTGAAALRAHRDRDGVARNEDRFLRVSPGVGRGPNQKTPLPTGRSGAQFRSTRRRRGEITQ